MKGLLLKAPRLRPGWAVAFLIGVGVLFRLRHYLTNRSLWLDEALLTLNILERDFAGLLQPLDYSQGAPPGFLLLVKVCVGILGNSEYALRLAPFLSGVLSLVGFYGLARRSLRPQAVPIAAGLFAVIGTLIVYSVEVKQYSSDVLVTIVLVYLAWLFSDLSWTWLHAICFGLVSAVSVWFSHPAIFTVAGVLACLLLASLSQRKWASTVKWLVVSLFPAASFGALYAVSLRSLGQHQGLLKMWDATFAPVLPVSVANIRWYFETFFDVFASSLRFYLPGVAALAFLAGCYAFYQRDKRRLCVFLSPLVLALLASMLHRYPFTGRFLLFAAPLLVLLIAEGAAFVWERTQSTAPIIGWLALLLLFLPSTLVAVTDAASPKGQEEVRETLAYLDKHWSEGDVLYVHHGARPAFRYYIERDPHPITNYIYGAPVENDYATYLADLRALCGNGRVWVLLSHINSKDGIDEGQLVWQCLESLGSQQTVFSAKRGAVLYLYDLSACADSEERITEDV